MSKFLALLCVLLSGVACAQGPFAFPLHQRETTAPVQVFTPEPLAPVQGAEFDLWWQPVQAAASGKTILEACVKVGQGSSGGSGVLVGRAKTGEVLVLSAAHVFSSRGPARVRLRNGTSCPGYVHDLDRKSDVALLSAEVPPGQDVTVTQIAGVAPSPGAKAIKIGFPAYAGGEANVRRGQVLRTMGGFRFNASLYVRPGDSGGGVFAEDGTLISIVSGYTSGDVLWGSGTEALQEMVTKHEWTSCIRWPWKNRPKPPAGPGPGQGKPLPPPPEGNGKKLPPAEQPPDLKPVLDELAKLRKELAELQLKAGPKGDPGPVGAAGPRGEPGVQGPSGLPGSPGKDVDPARLAALEADLERLRKQTFIAELLDAKGEIKQRVLFGPEQPLRLKLVPVK